MGLSELSAAVWARVAAGLIAVGLFAYVLVLFNQDIEATAEVGVEAGTRSLDQPVLCEAVNGHSHDYVVAARGSTEQVGPLYGDLGDIIRKCGDARNGQSARMLVWAVPTIVIGGFAVSPPGRIRRTRRPGPAPADPAATS